MAVTLDVTRRYAGQLDALRFFCVTSVIFAHSMPEVMIGGYAPFDQVAMGGVNLFFVLSAFVITSQLLRTNDKRRASNDSARRALVGFYGKRAMRLAPAFYLALVAAVILNLPGMRYEFIWHALLGTNILFALHPEVAQNSIAGHLWSLNVQEQFYLFWPFVIFYLPRVALPFVFAGVFLFGVFSRSYFNVFPQWVLDMGPMLWIDALAAGAIMALYQHRGGNMLRFNALAAPLVLVVASPLAVQYIAGPIGLGASHLIAREALNMLFVLIVVNAVAGFRGLAGAVLDNGIVQGIGRISYGMYVYHLFLMAVFERAMARFGMAEHFDYGLPLFAALYPATLLAAAISWRYIESPVNAMRKRLNYVPPNAGAAAATPSPSVASARDGAPIASTSAS